MVCNTTYLITGANRGIGLGLTSTLLLRPNTIVIATIRTPETPIETLTALPKAPGSQLITVPLAYSTLISPANTTNLLNSLQSHQITKIDIVIANAGASSFNPLLITSISAVNSHFETNTLLPLLLFQTLHPLLSSSTKPKFILISSVLGSLAIGASEGDTLAYGMSKAAANYLVRKIHFDFPQIISVAIHPGWVKTENGSNYAESLGYAAGPPTEVEDSVRGVLKQIDEATKENTSGSFLGGDGKVIPW